MEVLEIKLSRQKHTLLGIKLIDNDSWIILNDNPGDYILDGYRFVNKRFIKRETKLADDNIKNKILNLKYQSDIIKPLEAIPLNNYKILFSYLKEQGVLVEVTLETDEYILIGKIVDVFEKSFVLEKISTSAIIFGKENLKFSLVRCVAMKTDYLRSFELYLDSEK